MLSINPTLSKLSFLGLEVTIYFPILFKNVNHRNLNQNQRRCTYYVFILLSSHVISCSLIIVSWSWRFWGKFVWIYKSWEKFVRIWRSWGRFIRIWRSPWLVSSFFDTHFTRCTVAFRFCFLRTVELTVVYRRENNWKFIFAMMFHSFDLEGWLACQR